MVLSPVSHNGGCGPVAALFDGAEPASVVPPRRGAKTCHRSRPNLQMNITDGVPFDWQTLYADVVLIGTLPDTTGLPVRHLLVTTEFVVVPTVLQGFGVQHAVGWPPAPIPLLGYFINMKQRVSVPTAFETQLRRLFSDQVVETVIPRRWPFRRQPPVRRRLSGTENHWPASKPCRRNRRGEASQ